MYSWDFREIFKNTYFAEHMRTASSEIVLAIQVLSNQR